MPGHQVGLNGIVPGADFCVIKPWVQPVVGDPHVHDLNDKLGELAWALMKKSRFHRRTCMPSSLVHPLAEGEGGLAEGEGGLAEGEGGSGRGGGGSGRGGGGSGRGGGVVTFQSVDRRTHEC